MKKIAKISLWKLFLLASSLFSNDNDYLFYYQIRGAFLSLDEGYKIPFKEHKVWAIGGKIGLKAELNSAISAGAELYLLKALKTDSETMQEILNSKRESFETLSQIYMEAQHKNTLIKMGRQLIDTPHADSDDVKTMPNYFTAYILQNREIKDLTVTIGKITHMAGWENGVDARKFKRISEILDIEKKTSGILFASAVYEGVKNLSLQGWFYNIDEVANVLYLEATYETDIGEKTLTLGLQTDTATDTGESLKGDIKSKTYGISVTTALKKGLSITLAYNKSEDDGAFVSFGGGPFFTSMEDQTIDAIGEKGYSWMTNISQDLSDFGLKGVVLEGAYGGFRADRGDYKTFETDISLNYSSKNLSLTAVYAYIENKTPSKEDYSQIRVIANYDFQSSF